MTDAADDATVRPALTEPTRRIRCEHREWGETTLVGCHDTLPIAIREDVVVRVANLPIGLTAAEVGRIGRVLRACAIDGRADDAEAEPARRDSRS